MKKILLIRLGSDTPLPKEMQIINQISENMRFPAIGLPMPSLGVMSFFYTKFNPSDILELYRAVEEETGDTLPIIVIDLEGDGGVVGFDKYLNFDTLIEKFDTLIENYLAENNEDPEPETNTVKQVTTLQLDDILDLINTRGGIEKLTADERARLEELTK